MNCVKCDRNIGNENFREAYICLSIAGEERIDSYWLCIPCGLYTVEAYTDRFSGSSYANIHGALTREEGRRIRDLIQTCPDRNDKHCNCDAHRSLSGMPSRSEN